MLAAGWYLKWFSAATALGFAVTFLVIYALVWAVSYLRYRHTVSIVNARLRER